MSIKATYPFLLALSSCLAFTSCPARGAARPGDDVQAVKLTTGDGAELSGRYFLGNRGGKSPAVLVLDDVGDAARPKSCDAVARELAKEGCTVLCFDFRGQGGSRQVNPEFWDDATNRRLVKGFKTASPPEAIRHADFKPGYLPTLVNDITAARAYLERRNDAGECNTGQIFVIGFGRGATLGQMWLASEWFRFRVAGFQAKLAPNPEGRDVAGCVWVDPQFALDRQTIPVFELIRKSQQKKSLLVGLIHDDGDPAATKLARLCKEAFNPKGGATLFVAETIPAEGDGPVAARDGIRERVGKLVAKMQEVQDLPPWDDRDFVDRRYVWSFPGTPLVLAKDEGESRLRPLPVGHILGSR
jgi:pimeloyl-ACP methyl ester carboxylesterase